ncbi:hypothetical protein BC938DRAFT_477346, partial [Jimgerdemannia flammicorona]
MCLRRKEAGAGGGERRSAVGGIRWTSIICDDESRGVSKARGRYMTISELIDTDVDPPKRKPVGLSGGARTNAGRKESIIKRTTFCIPPNPRNAPISEDEYERLTWARKWTARPLKSDGGSDAEVLPVLDRWHTSGFLWAVRRECAPCGRRAPRAREREESRGED